MEADTIEIVEEGAADSDEVGVDLGDAVLQQVGAVVAETPSPQRCRQDEIESDSEYNRSKTLKLWEIL